MNVLVLNSGSSSLKFQLIATGPGRTMESGTQKNQVVESGAARLCRGVIEWIGGEAIITVQSPQSPKQKFTDEELLIAHDTVRCILDESRLSNQWALSKVA